MAQPGVEPGSLTDRVSVLTTTLLNHTGPHLSVSLRNDPPIYQDADQEDPRPADL